MIGRYLLRQFAQPHGKLGVFFAGLMNRGNAVINAHAVEALRIRDGDRVLDVGFGGAATLEKLLREGRVSFAGGVDPSPEVVRAAEARLAPWIADGRLEVRLGTAEAIPWPEASFDRVLSVNSIYYWSDPLQGARELYRVLRPGGAAVLALRDKAAIDKMGIERFGYRALGEVEVTKLLEQAGFSAVESSSREDKVRGGVVLVRAVTS
jgi:ubiquinone/menaquinone biosynthesis C-methylase UbiE